MASPRMRPRFELRVADPPQRVADRLRAAIEAPDAPVVGRQLRRHAQLRVRDGARHFWSPQVSLDILESEEGTRIKGLFGPHPELWTFFMALYAVISFVGFCGVMYGFSKWMVNESPVAMLLLPAALVADGVVYGIGMVGRGLGEPQMREQRAFIASAVGADDGADGAAAGSPGDAGVSA